MKGGACLLVTYSMNAYASRATLDVTVRDRILVTSNHVSTQLPAPTSLTLSTPAPVLQALCECFQSHTPISPIYFLNLSVPEAK